MRIVLTETPQPRLDIPQLGLARERIEDAGSLFEHEGLRPTPEHMADLIGAGVADRHIVAAWTMRTRRLAPDLSLLRAEMPRTVSYIRTASEYLAATTDSNTLELQAARDMEPVHDHLRTLRPGTGVLLPSSSSLFWSQSMQEPAIVRAYLQTYGVTQDRINDPASKIRISDTCSRGTIGHTIARLIGETFDNGEAAAQTPRYANELMHVSDGGRSLGWATEMPVSYEGNPDTDLPRTRQWMGEKFALRQQPAYGAHDIVACALQNLPRFHGAFTDAIVTPAGVRMVTAREPFTEDINNPVSGASGNDSVVQPLAAALVQRAVVADALSLRQSR